MMVLRREAVRNGVINMVTICFGLSVGAEPVAEKFLQSQTLCLPLLGVIAFGLVSADGALIDTRPRPFRKN